MAARRGISPVVATIVIVAVAIALSIAVAAWLFQVYGSLGETAETLRVMPYSFADAANDIVYLYVRNEGPSPVEVVAVSISGELVQLQTPVQVQPGEETLIQVQVPKDAQGNPVVDIQPGTSYTVIVYTGRGGAYTVVVTGK